MCLVHGDTPSTLMATLMARRAGLTIAHLESGLRSGSFRDPFPEELIRVLVMRQADVEPGSGPVIAALQRVENLHRPARLRSFLGLLGRLAADGWEVLFVVHPPTGRVRAGHGGRAAVEAKAVIAGTIAASSGSATVAPMPRRNVRRGSAFLVIIIMISSSETVYF